MDLLLWRHAHANDAHAGQSDMDRALSKKGERQAALMAKWLSDRLPAETLILCSPAKRTLQTVAHLGRPYQLCTDISPDANAQDLLNAAAWPHFDRPVLAVAHQPFLSEAVARVLGLPLTTPLSFRKGGLWWLRQKNKEGVDRVELVGVLNPELLL